MVGDFDLVMQDNIYCIQNKKIHHNYLSYKIQNELIYLIGYTITSSVL
jgi:hypothetical protein